MTMILVEKLFNFFDRHLLLSIMGMITFITIGCFFSWILLAIGVGLLVIIMFRVDKKIKQDFDNELTKDILGQFDTLQTKYELTDEIIEMEIIRYINNEGLEDPEFAEALSNELESRKQLRWFKNSKEIEN